MRDLDDAALEHRLRAVLKEHLERLPLDLTVDALDRRREAKEVARRFSRGRGMTLLAAAALLLVGGALAAGTGLLRLPSVVQPVPSPSEVAVATASPDATSPSPSESAAPSPSPIPVAGPGGLWIQVGSMVTPRSGHDAVRLLDGPVLIVGGTENSNGPELTSAELYDPATGTWSVTEGRPRAEHVIPPVVLRDGTVLVGDSVYVPASGTWTATGPMVSEVGGGATATLLRDGRVLVYGPTGGQLYDPDGGTWSATRTMITPRHGHTATLLRDGKVLVAGGSCDVSACGYSPAGEAELYDPVTGSWTAIANSTTKGGRWAGLLRDGTVLLIGASANLYDPTSGTWSTLAAPPEAGNPVALLADDTVLLAVEGPPPACTAAALYDPHSGSWTSASSMLRCISAVGAGPLFTLLSDGTVLAAGVSQCNDDSLCVATGAAELYVPAGVSLPSLPAFPSPAPPVFPSPTPVPTPLPPAAGPVPPNARSWTVTVDNRSSEPATLFVAEDDGTLRLVGSATPNVVPAGATVKVTFLFPPDGGWIFVNPRPGEGGGLVGEGDIGIPGKILVMADGQVGWVSPSP